MKDSDTISVSLSGVMTMPFGNAIPSATFRAVPSGVMSAMTPVGGFDGSLTRSLISAKSKPMLLT